MKPESLQNQLAAQFYRGNRAAFCLAVFASLATGSLNLILSWLMQQLIDLASGIPGALPMKALIVLTVLFTLLCLTLSLMSYASTPRFIRRAMVQYRDFAFRRLTEKSIASFRDESAAAYLSALTNDASSIEADYLSQQFQLITSAVTFVGALAVMLCYSPLLTAIAILVTALPLAASLLTGGRLQSAERRVSDQNHLFTAALSDCLSGFSVIKSFKAEKEIFRLFSASNRALEQEKFSRRRIKAVIGMIGSITGMVAQLGVFIAGAYLALTSHGLTAGMVILFVNLMNFIIEPIAQLPTLLASRKAARGLIGKLAAQLEDHPSPCGDATLSRLQNAIELRGVSFAYADEKPVLRGVNATLAAGKAYALVGASGSGKSTLLGLLMGAGTPSSGSILLDGIPVQSLAPEALYGLMSVIQQNVFVFNASIRDNVTMFRDFPPAQVDEAIQGAHLTELLARKGDQYLCGEGGNGLSGGEKQRIAIARSLLRRSSILLADEATSALDAQTAHQVAGDLLDLQGVTRVIVTHTLEASLLRRYDGILVLRDGRIEECGQFDALMEKKGYFYSLYTVAQ